jgi:hypothetical protein
MADNYKASLLSGSKVLYALAAEIKSQTGSLSPNEVKNYTKIKINEDRLTENAKRVSGKITSKSVTNIISGIDSIKHKSLSVFGKHTTGEIERLRVEVKKQWKQYGAICDREGFYQHTGECWSDSLQMLYLFADGCKEVVQPKLVSLNIDTINVDGLILKLKGFLTSVAEKLTIKEDKASLEQLLNRPDFNTYQKSIIVTYLKSTQHRFFRHYLIETNRRRVESECILDSKHERDVYKQLINIGKLYRNKGVNARKAAGVQTVPLNTVAYRKSLLESGSGPGGNMYDRAYIDMIYNIVFFDNNLTYIEIPQCYPKISPDLDSNFHTYKENIASAVEDTSTAIAIGTVDHALLFYTCGNQQLFYDDNSGIIKFPWKTYLNIVNSPAQEGKPLIPHFFLGAKLYSPNEDYVCSFYPFIAIDGAIFTYIEDNEPVFIGQYEQPDKITSLDGLSIEEWSKPYLPKKFETYKILVTKKGGDYKVKLDENSWQNYISYLNVVVLPGNQTLEVKNIGNHTPLRMNQYQGGGLTRRHSNKRFRRTIRRNRKN